MERSEAQWQLVPWLALVLAGGLAGAWLQGPALCLVLSVLPGIAGLSLVLDANRQALRRAPSDDPEEEGG
jgi:hypothetical protein